ncbi:MAG: LEA type 2 family protein [candidate division WOR-3 bacterium]|nr:LEA type 2 family protein [candidate division WOR-3 bacterium]MCX7947660.1 LEA type 2 family protein [candidate division WOR-3 bacterium]MDW8150537.1 LEA type 2 family protein [candidate division WOR-3 bacterium]
MKIRFLVLSILLGCAFFQERLNVKNLKFSYRDATIEALTMDRLNFIVNLEAYNPNDIDAVIDKLDYTVYFEDIKAISGYTNQTYEVKAKGRRIISVSGSILFSDLPDLFKAIRASYGKSRVKITAELRPEVKTIIGKFRYKVKIEEYIPLNWR